MNNLEELLSKIRVNGAEGEKDALKRLRDALLILDLNLDPRNKFGGEYERMSKVVSMADVLYWYLVVLVRTDMNLDQILRIVIHKLDTTDQSGPEINVMPPTVKNEDNTNP